MRIAIFIHTDVSDSLMATGVEGARAIGRLTNQAIRVAQNHGPSVVYAPAHLPDGRGCAMSIRPSGSGLIVEIDPPGTALNRVGIVTGGKGR